MKYTPDNDGECNTACKCEDFLGTHGKRVGCRYGFAAGRAIKMKTFPMTQRKPLPFLFMLQHWKIPNAEAQPGIIKAEAGL
jgi:hypothetical protein